jgi:hypothetical protein
MAEPTQQELFEFATTPPAAEPEPQPTEVAAPEPAPTPEPASPESVPSWRLREEAEARRLAEDRSRTLEERLNMIVTHLQQNQQKPDFFAKPEESVQALVQRAVQPMADEYRRGMIQMGHSIANAVHGADKVAAAENAFLEAMRAQTLDPMDYEKVVQAPNRYDAVVQWHTHHSVLSSVGNDPNAWFEKQLEARMSDPAFQAKLMEKVRGTAAARPGAVKLPPSLSRTTAAAGNAPEVEGDLSDQSLFAYAMKR